MRLVELPKPPTWLYWPIVWLLWIAHRFCWQQLICEGLEKIPASGGAILAPSHLSDCDPPSLSKAFGRLIQFMAKIELFLKSWLTRFFYHNTGCFPVDRNDGASFVAAKNLAVRLASEDGAVVGIFPEGTKRQGTEMGVLHSGAVRAAIEANVPLYAVGMYYPRPGKPSPIRWRQVCVIVVTDPLTPEELSATRKPLELLRAKLEEAEERARVLFADKQAKRARRAAAKQAK